MKGILFRPDMIKAIAEGRKTQTRRIIKPQPQYCRAVPSDKGGWYWLDTDSIHNPNWLDYLATKARYQVGETVFIQEAWRTMAVDDNCPPSDISSECRCLVQYKLDNLPSPTDCIMGKWRSPLFMPAWAARYHVRITDVRAERLKEITLQDCWDEGIDTIPAYDRIDAYKKLWDSINPKSPWSSNPFVWIYTFDKLEH